MKTSTKIHDFPRIAGTSIAVILKEASSTRIGGRKILLGRLVQTTLYVALQSEVSSWLDKLAIDKLNGRAIESTSVVGPAENLIPESMMVECVVPTAAPSSFRPSEFSLTTHYVTQCDFDGPSHTFLRQWCKAIASLKRTFKGPSSLGGQRMTHSE